MPKNSKRTCPNRVRENSLQRPENMLKKGQRECIKEARENA
jgi:hypothetical protein